MVSCTRSYCSTVSYLSSYAANPTIASGTSSTTQWKPHPSAPWQPRANLATAKTPDNSSWLLDNGASHHVTSDLSNLSIHTPYDGSDDIVIGYGMSLLITHTDSKYLSTLSHTFSLNNVFCVPTMKNNLISISKLCQTNNTSIEFLPTSFLVNDLRMGATLLQGRTKDGMYVWQVLPVKSSPLLEFSSVKTTSSKWHHRLGHPSSPIFRHIVFNFHLELSTPLNLNFNCNSCQCNKSHKLHFSISSIATSSPLDIIFFDLWTSLVHYVDDFKYYVIFRRSFYEIYLVLPIQTKFTCSWYICQI